MELLQSDTHTPSQTSSNSREDDQVGEESEVTLSSIEVELVHRNYQVDDGKSSQETQHYTSLEPVEWEVHVDSPQDSQDDVEENGAVL